MRTLILICRPDAADVARVIAARHPGTDVRVTIADTRSPGSADPGITGPADPRIPGSPDLRIPGSVLFVQVAPWHHAGDLAWTDALIEAAERGDMAVALPGEVAPGRFAAHVRAWLGAEEDAPSAAGDGVDRWHRAFTRDGALAGWRTRLIDARPLAFAIGDAALTAAGGFEWQHHGIAEVEDLAARVLADGRDVVTVAAGGLARADDDSDALGPAADAGTAAFLVVGARLRTMMRGLAGETRGRAVAEALCEAIGEAWRASAVQTSRLSFGGAWGKRPFLRRSRVAAARAAGLWPADEAGTLMPLLAIDAVADWIVASADELGNARQRAPREGTAPSPSAARGDSMADPRIPGSPDPLSLSVSVITVSWDGREHLEPCLASLEASTLARERFEIVLVDNGSRDGSVDFVRARFPAVRIVALAENQGFTGGNCAGVAAARGDVLVFLNNDMRVEPSFLERLIASLDDAHPCSAARVLSWDGRRIDFVAGTMNFEGRGYQLHYGAPAHRDVSGTASTFFPNGGAFAITREAYERAGGFDRALFAYYDDIDLGWGVRASGGDIAMAGDAIAYHRHGATSRRQPAGQKQFLLERNSLVTTLKRYEPATLDAVLPVMLFLRVRRVLDGAALDARHPHARWLAGRSRRVGTAAAHGLAKAGPHVSSGGAFGTAAAPHVSTGGVSPGLLREFPTEQWAALGAALGMLPHVASERARLAASRRVGDADLVTRFGATFESASPGQSWHLAQEELMRAFGANRALEERPGVLVVTHEPLQARMSGPGIRALELARALAPVASVVLATPYRPELSEPHLTFWQYDPEKPASLRKAADRCDVFIVQGFTLLRFPFLADTGTLVVDLYCPFTVEHLEMHASRLASGEDASLPVVAEAASLLEIQGQQLAAGDFFLCASERQRDFWIGALHSAGRVNPETYTADPTLRRLIDVVPFGVADEPPEAQMARQGLAPAIKGRLAGVPADAFVLLWAGSMLDWQDPETLIAAVARVATTHPQVRLVFMGTKHPNPQVAPMRVVDRSRALAASLGIEGRHVTFNDWVDYDARAAWLADADVGVSTHGDHLETRLSFRTRMLDYLWAGLPIVCSEGDWFAELVARERLGLVVPAGDVEALAGALQRMMDDAALRSESARRAREVGQAMRWSAVTRPLVDFVAAARPAADRARMAQERKRLAAGGYGIVKRMKRAARAAGMSEATIERLKDSSPGRALMLWQHRRAHDRAKRQAGRGGHA